jgi:hypothetical protein
MEVNGQLHTSVVLPRGNNPRYPLDMRLDGPKRLSGRYWKEKILASAGNMVWDKHIETWYLKTRRNRPLQGNGRWITRDNLFPRLRMRMQQWRKCWKRRFLLAPTVSCTTSRRRHFWHPLSDNGLWKHRRLSECCNEKLRAWISERIIITYSYEL